MAPLSYKGHVRAGASTPLNETGVLIESKNGGVSTSLYWIPGLAKLEGYGGKSTRN